MKKTFTIFFATLALLLVSTVMWAQNITFVVDMTLYLNAGGTIGDNGVHITGNITNPTWTPKDNNYRLTNVGGNTYSITLNVANFPTITDPDYRFKFTNSHKPDSSWGDCHVDQECLPSGGSCTNGGDDNRSLGPVGSLPSYDAVYNATWDSCAGTYYAPVGISEVQGAIAYVNSYPNPAVDNTTISLVLAQSAKNVTLTVYNPIGQVMERSELTNQGAGLHNYVINTSTFSNGTYLYSLNADGTFATSRLVVSK